jgi:multicomponent Na+:H+ antiporter subunit E
MLRAPTLFVLFYAFWILMSGYFTPFLLGIGALVSAAVVWFVERMRVADREGHPVHLGWSALAYWPWLAKEILKSALDVSKVILDPRLPATPTVVSFRPSQKTVVGLVTHANSITLTPGTLSVEVTAERFVVHGLTRAGAEGCTDSEMDRRVTRFEGES